jgi:ABC-type antimicrobial peptide transport system permease subunit
MSWLGRRRRLRHLRFQTLLAIAAVGVAVALPVVLLSVGGGVAAHELQALEQTGYQVVVGAPGLHGIEGTHALTSRIDGLADVRAASPILSLPVTVFLPGGGQAPLLAEGVIPSTFLATVSPEESGLFPSPLPLGDPSDLHHFANGTYLGPAVNSMLVSSPFANSRSVVAGEALALSVTGNRSQATVFNVTGTFGVPPSLLGPTGAFVAILPLSDLQLLSGEARGAGGSAIDGSDTIQVALAGAASSDPSTVAAVAQEIGSLVPYYQVSTLTQEVQSLQSAESVLTGFYLALSSFSLAIGLVFLGVLLVRRVDAMRSSIAIRRALGLPARSLAAEFARTALLLAGGGVVLGLVAGVLLVRLLASYGSPSVAAVAALAQFDPITLASLAAAVLAIGLLLSLVATRSALRLSLPEALR